MKTLTIIITLLHYGFMLQPSQLPLVLQEYNQNLHSNAVSDIIEQTDTDTTGLDMDFITNDPTKLHQQLMYIISSNPHNANAFREKLHYHINNSKTFVLECNGPTASHNQVVGFASCCITKNPSILMVQQFAIDGDHKGKKYGATLLNAIAMREEYANIQGIRLNVLKKNFQAQDFFHKMGFREYEHSEDAICMHKIKYPQNSSFTFP